MLYLFFLRIPIEMITSKTILFLALVLLTFSKSNAQTSEAEKEDNTIYTTLEISPSFPGGLDSLKSYVKRHTIYPEIYRRYRYTERLFVNFVIEKDGSVSNIKLIQGGFREFEKAALDIVKNMPRWNPALQNGKPMRCYMTLPINFCPDGCVKW